MSVRMATGTNSRRCFSLSCGTLSILSRAKLPASPEKAGSLGLKR